MLARLFFAFSLLASAFAGTALAQNTVSPPMPAPWYDHGYTGTVPTTLKAATADERAFLGADNVGWHMRGPEDVCAAMHSVHLACDYNTRVVLVNFLNYYGKDIMHGTNPYVNDLRKRGDWWSSDFDIFIGEPNQNHLLAVAIQRNERLFHDGNLTAAAVKHWR